MTNGYAGQLGHEVSSGGQVGYPGCPGVGAPGWYRVGTMVARVYQGGLGVPGLARVYLGWPGLTTGT